MHGRRVVLIGGAGFIGHHLALALKAAGAHVMVVDSLQVNHLGAFNATSQNLPHRELYLSFLNERLSLLRLHEIPVFVLDARDYNTLSLRLGEMAPDTLVHLAAVAHAGRSNKDPFNTFDHSLRTLENALDSVRDTIEHFIYFSSSMVYGNWAADVVTETTQCDPVGIYGALKYAGEKLVIAYHQVFGLPYTIIRPSALYGERCVSRRVSQIFLEAALHGEPLTVTGDGSDRLDFTYVQDLVQGLLKVMTVPAAKNEIFNLTCGQGRALSELVDILGGIFPDLKVHQVPRDGLMPERGTLSIDKARDLLGYAPAFPLEEGLPRYLDWYRTVIP